ncbi:MAG: hypothetical protein K1X48_11620 [Burkholderiaceae bacterium]|nr:hypothetical protein [Burkholderiaceae bacterium]
MSSAMKDFIKQLTDKGYEKITEIEQRGMTEITKAQLLREVSGGGSDTNQSNGCFWLCNDDGSGTFARSEN